ncbi:MAG: SulP family inorganic anion transporter [Solirubrobacteraceae bacterium]
MNDGHRPFRPAPKAPVLQRAIPVSAELPGYRPHRARRDGLAALTVAALAIPSAMAYAELAGVTAVAGLYALLVPTVVYGLLGSSRQLIVGPEGSISALAGASVLGLAAAGSAHAGELAATLALLVGGCFLLARVVRLGWLADYLSRPVLIGYIHGVAVVLIIGQLEKLTGIDVQALDPLPGLVEALREIGEVNLPTLAVGVTALAVLLPLRFLAPRVPAALLVVAGAIAASSALDLAGAGVAVVGSIPSGLPAPRLPSPPLGDVLTMLPAAVGIFLVCFADEVLTARSFAGRHDQHVRVDQELLAMGGAQMAAGLTQGLPIGASGSRTAVNDEMGAQSQLAGLAAAVIVALVLLFLTGPIADLPKAVLGAIIVSAAIGLVEPASWRALADTDKVELAIAAVTAAGVVAVGVLEAIAFAAGLSMIDVVRRSARPHDAVLGWVDGLGRWADVAVHRSARVTPGVVVYRLDDRLFFANQSYVTGRIREAVNGALTETHDLVLDAEGVTHVDVAGLEALGELRAGLARDGITLRVARMKAPVRARLADSGLVRAIGPERFHPTVRAAVAGAVPASPSPGGAPPGGRR